MFDLKNEELNSLPLGNPLESARDKAAAGETVASACAVELVRGRALHPDCVQIAYVKKI